MAATMDKPLPWVYWRVQFAERGICRWDEFDDMDMEDVNAVIAVWDGVAKVQQDKVDERLR